MSSSSRTPSLTPSRSPSPAPPVQPDHFYGSEDIQLPPSPNSDGKTWLDPEDDPLAHRGIPVFKPTMEEFQDFEGYVTKIECWGMKSGIVKVIPPKEWTDALPPLKDQLVGVKIRTPIEQHMLGRGGLFRQENMEKRKLMSVREWAELCAKEEFRAPGVGEVGLQARNGTVKPRTTRRTKKKTEIVKAESVGPDSASLAVKQEPIDDDHPITFGDSGSNNDPLVLSPPSSDGTPPSPGSESAAPATTKTEDTSERKPKKRVGPSREAREAALAGRAAQDLKFLETFNPKEDWLPPNTKASDYTREFCQTLERHYWRNCGLGKPAWYGADTQGSLYTDETTVWNVAHLPSTLSRLLPADSQGLPGVNTPYLYFGMWRATFAWHVEDMDLFSINFIHFGAPKFWYAIPQGRAAGLEQTMRGYFPKDTSQCPQFLRHKSFLASPTLLAQSSCRPNFLVQHSGEFVITFPRGYHAGFNLGFNCAESVNFALDSWLELGRRAKACECVSDSVRIDVDQLMADRAAEAANPKPPPQPKRPSSKKENGNKDLKDAKRKVARKRKIEDADEQPKAKKLKIKLSSSSTLAPSSKVPPPKLSITLKLGPRPTLEPYPCCLCVSMDREGLLRVHDPPIGRKDAEDAAGNPTEWMAHEFCASVVPETWVDEIEVGPNNVKEKVVYGVDGIVKDRWHLKCSACTKARPRAHGAPIQCTKGKCPKAFHVSCAREGAESGIMFTVVREVEKEVVLLEPLTPAPTTLVTPAPPDAMQVDAGAAHPDVNGMATDPSPSSRVLKVIKKHEVQVLCSQHNPVVAAAKKEAKQDKIKAELLALPPMARVKLRVSSGVFEVSLIRVIEATRSVEVLWDKGDKKEFKWNSVIFGNTEGPVLQKPAELVPKPEPIAVGVPVPTYKSVTAATASRPPQHADSPPVASTSKATMTRQYGAPNGYAYPPRAPPYDYWQYQNSQYSAMASSHPYGYPGYYPASQPVAGSSHYNAYAYTQNQYNSAQFWQQPYQKQAAAYYRPGDQQPQHNPIDNATSQGQQNHPPPTTNGSTHNTYTPQQPAGGLPPAQTVPNPAAPSTLSPELQQGLYKNLATLSSLQPTQFSDMMRDNPHLREVVMAAVGEAQQTLATS
ncbi:putative jmjN domain containing protein [Lyophyllum shimeji]|uniref:[histone H3]-trimethyl-L-lysine(9) demethylase n=1 Tax=Lyophyllum shimeji TaxID=47721 RepID=A0A9P3PWB5_LYOSH|nr:putative jmjN domain containing protein [Lyophyllum shimeji]